ncbi:DUF1565 domain-containing protein [Kaistia sp. MMO-174]|uniref:DUF1565 domain-containing protein n=2 Tax=Kaistia sp. MMO-174 TaxID=3081256 RepID=UPI0030194982
MLDLRTDNLGYLLPAKTNLMRSEDVPRLIESLKMIDADIAEIITGMVLLAPLHHSHEMADIVGLVNALVGKSSVGHNHGIGTLTGVDFSSATSGQWAKFNGTLWIPAFIVAADLADKIISNAKLRDSVALSLIGRAASSTGSPADIVAAANDTFLRRVGDALGFGQLTIGMVPDSLLTFVKLASAAIASQAEAEAGSATNKLMTPERTGQAIAKRTRELLTGDRTFYVSTSGNDANDGLTSGAPFLTIQAAIAAALKLDTSVYTVIIQLADGTYTAGGIMRAPLIGSGRLRIQGNNATPGNVIVTADACFASEGGRLEIRDLEMRATSAGNCLAASNSGTLWFRNVRFGASAGGAHMNVSSDGKVLAEGAYSIVGAAAYHAVAYGGLINCQSQAITLAGTPAFSSAFALSSLLSTVVFGGCTFTGSATGKRYQGETNSLITVWGGGSSFLPGNSAGTSATGAQYI